MNDTNCAPTLLVNFTTTKYEHYRSQSVLQTLLLEQAKQNPNPNLKKGTNKNANPNVTNRSCAITFTCRNTYQNWAYIWLRAFLDRNKHFSRSRVKKIFVHLSTDVRSSKIDPIMSSYHLYPLSFPFSALRFHQKKRNDCGPFLLWNFPLWSRARGWYERY